MRHYNRIKLISLVFILLMGVISCQETTNSSDEIAIREVLQKAESAWNAGNLVNYMNSYWQSDSLMFVGGKTISYGWKTTLLRYQKSYPNKAAMGKLSFSNIRIIFKDKKTALIMGKWKLEGIEGNPEGRYTLIFKKISGGWKIIYDHSS